MKAHITIALPSRAIINVTTPKATIHDAKVFGELWSKFYKHPLKRVKRVHLDKGYWSEKIIGFLVQEGIQPIIPKKSNSINHGTDSAID